MVSVNRCATILRTGLCRNGGRMMKKQSLGVLLAVVLALVTAGREAKGFGQNKVQYRNLEWRTLHTAHFDVYFYDLEH